MWLNIRQAFVAEQLSPNDLRPKATNKRGKRAVVILDNIYRK